MTKMPNLNKPKGIVAVDLFCGAGGLTRGLLDAGIKVVKGFDINQRFKKTYEMNNPGAKFIPKDVSKINKKEILEGINKSTDYFLLAGCAPCQPFSTINKQNSEGDRRKWLLLEFGRLVEETKPNFIFIEKYRILIRNRGEFEATSRKRCICRY